MPPLPSRRNSTKIADVLRVLHNPRTPETAKQQTLRRLDGLEGRHAPAPKRRSLDSAHEEVHPDTSTATTTGSGSETRCRLGVSTGVAPLSLPEDESRPRPSNMTIERRAIHAGSSSPTAPSRSPPSSRRRVIFMDQWGVAGQEVFFHEPERPDGIPQNN